MQFLDFHRRHFLVAAGAGAVAIASKQFFSNESKSSAQRPVIGQGEHVYEVEHDWGQLPATIAWGNTHAVCADSHGNVLVAHTVAADSAERDAVVVFDAEGKFVRSWGAEFQGSAHGLHLERRGSGEFLILCDPARHAVVKTDLRGEEVWRRQAPLESGLYEDDDEFWPTNAATAPNGDVYVADGYGKSYIHHYDANGAYIRSFGGPGSEPGRTSCPHGIVVDTRGAEPAVVVADRGNRRLQYFTLEGEHLRFVTKELRAPCHFDLRGDLLLVPDLESRLTLLDSKDDLVIHLGDGGHYKGIRDKPRAAFPPGKFIAPHGACFDSEGNIFVVEWVEVGRVSKLRKLA